MIRTFIAIEIPGNIKKEILKIQKQIPSFEGRITDKENLHVTLKFLGEIEEEKVEEIKKRLAEIKYKSFEAKIDKIGFFDNQDRGVIWVHVANCEELQKEVDKGVLLKKEPNMVENRKMEGKFMSHLTIARTKYIENKNKFLEDLGKIKISPLKFSVNEFILKESIPQGQKHIYKDLKKYKLI